MSEHRWMSSGFLRAAPVGEVNADKGVIEGVSVCTVGEAKGHGINLDSEFVAAVAEMGNAKKQGLKARFGHPNMCSTALGTFLGRFKNFRVEAEQVLADLFLSNEAKETPHGNLFDYVMGMAVNEPDMFGTSIVFTPGRMYQRDEDGSKVVVVDEFSADPNLPMFVECAAVHACDAVDEPAANDGLFSRFSQETIAGQITEFLDLHPHVWDAIESNPSIIEALARHGDKVDTFTESYRLYREQNGKGRTMKNEDASSEQLEEASVDEPEALETPEQSEDIEASADAEGTEGAEATEQAAKAELTEQPEAVAVDTAEPPALEVAEADALRARLGAVDADIAQLTARAESAESDNERIVSELTATTDALTAVTEERDELRVKLAAYDKGAAPVSAAPAGAELGEDISPWKKAQKKR